MHIQLRYLVVLLFGLWMLPPLYAKGTEVGTLIVNHANITYIMDGKEHNSSSNTDRFVIDHIIDLDISWQDSAHIIVGSGDKSVILSFRLTNLGNGEDTFALSYEHNTTDSFDPPPKNVLLYIDTDGSGAFDIAQDIQIMGDINITADHNITLFVVADIADANDTNYTNNELSHDGILAKSTSQPTEQPDRADLVDAVVRTGVDVAMGIYEIREFWFDSSKSVTGYQ